MELKGLKVGLAVTGSFCTLSKVINLAKDLVNCGINVYPIVSDNVYKTDTRFYKAKDFIKEFEEITKKQVIKSIVEAESVGPKKLVDIMLVAPCTGNTLAKLNLGITDTAVTMAVKSHLRNLKPVIIGVSTNDGLSNSYKNIASLNNYKNIYFIPYAQDNYEAKPNSLVADFSKAIETIEKALDNKQIKIT